MKTMILSILFGVLLVFTVNADFLPEDNSAAFGLEYAESIAGFIPNVPKIDGKLDDWKYAVWVAFDSEDELLRGKGVWEGKDDLTMTWSTMYELGKGGMIYEVAMPFTALTKVKVKEGTEVGFTPGYEEGTGDPEKKGELVFMDWHGLNPDDSANLGTLMFGGLLAVDAVGKLTLTWGQLKKPMP